MFDYVQNMRLNIVTNKVSNKIRVDEEPISLIRTKNQQKIKALLDGTDVVNVEQWISILSKT